MTDRKEMPCNSCGTLPAQPQIIFPPENGTVRGLSVSFGQARACSPIEVSLDGRLIARDCTDPCGHWQVPIRPEPSDGLHCLCVMDCECSGRCIYFTVASQVQPPPTPVISYPTSSIPESSPLIYGTAEPGAAVRICVDNAVCGESTADDGGAWSWQYPGELAEGYHIVTAAAIGLQGIRSSTACRPFHSEGFTEFLVTLTDAHEGSRFRTVALDLTIASTLFPVTLYFLFLPPGSPVPDEDRILSYTGPGLTDGTAARGSVELPAGGRQTVELTGRENAPAESLGVVDNLRYDIYVAARAGEERSEVLSFPGVLSMPFAGGRGISGAPYLIAELSRDEIHRDYPDLAADRNPLGVDDTARMLRNIDDAQALYESSGGTHGIRNSMALDYHLATSIDLSGYADAGGGMGWTPIRGLTVIREGLQEMEGLFAESLDGEFDGLTLENTVIRLSVSTEPGRMTETSIGLLAARMQGGSLRDITITGAEVTVSDRENIPVIAGFGGIADLVQDLRTGERLLVEHLNLDIPRHGIVFGPV